MLHVETLSFFIIPVGIAEISTSLYGWLSSGGPSKWYVVHCVFAAMPDPPFHPSLSTVPHAHLVLRPLDPERGRGVEPERGRRLDYPQDREPVELNLAKNIRPHSVYPTRCASAFDRLMVLRVIEE